MVTNTDYISIFHKVPNEDSLKQSTYHKLIIPDVWWKGGTFKQLRDGILESAEIYKISIYGKRDLFLPDYEWNKLEEKGEFWTLSPMDFIVKGKIDGDYSKLKEITGLPYEVTTVMGIKDLRHSKTIPYIRVEGKR